MRTAILTAAFVIGDAITGGMNKIYSDSTMTLIGWIWLAFVAIDLVEFFHNLSKRK